VWVFVLLCVFPMFPSFHCLLFLYVRSRLCFEHHFSSFSRPTSDDIFVSLASANDRAHQPHHQPPSRTASRYTNPYPYKPTNSYIIHLTDGTYLTKAALEHQLPTLLLREGTILLPQPSKNIESRFSSHSPVPTFGGRLSHARAMTRAT